MRILHRRKAAEGNQIIMCGTRQLLCRTCLAADIISLDFGQLSGTALDGLEQSFLYEITGRLGGSCPEKLRLHILNNRSGCIQDLLHNVRTVIGAAVQKTCIGRCHLDHCNVKVLAERIGRQCGFAQRVRRVNQCGGICLCRQVNAGLLSESEDVLVFYKVLGSLRECCIHQVYVAGLHQCMLRIQCSVSVMVVAADLPGMHAVIQLNIALAYKSR